MDMYACGYRLLMFVPGNGRAEARPGAFQRHHNPARLACTGLLAVAVRSQACNASVALKAFDRAPPKLSDYVPMLEILKEAGCTSMYSLAGSTSQVT